MEEEIVCQQRIPFIVFPFLCFYNLTTSLVKCTEAATEFSISLLQTLVIEEPKVISELHNLIDALAKVCNYNLCGFIFLPSPQNLTIF
jgi:hypothetical protein